jgi:hypothetical protein
MASLERNTKVIDDILRPLTGANTINTTIAWILSIFLSYFLKPQRLVVLVASSGVGGGEDFYCVGPIRER